MSNVQPRILVLGKLGQLGWELQRVLHGSGVLTAVGSPEVDFTSADSIRRLANDVRPDIILNAVAYTAVDKAETEPDIAGAINGTGPGILAEIAKATGALLVHYSTDYVFDGTKADPYTEEDVPAPLNAYGRSKLAGDRAVQAVGGTYLIFRLSWVYSWRGKNFVRTILKLGSEKSELAVVDDQVGSPTAARFIAQATSQIVSSAWGRAHGKRDRIAGANSEFSGIYNLTCRGSVSWYGLAKAILESDEAQRINGRTPAIVPIRHSEYSGLAQRPANSRLSNHKLLETFGITLPEWQEALRLTLADIAEAASFRGPIPFDSIPMGSTGS